MSDVKAIRFFVEKSVLDIGVKIVFPIIEGIDNQGKNPQWIKKRELIMKELLEKYKGIDYHSDPVLEGFHVLHDHSRVKRRKNIPASEKLIRLLLKNEVASQILCKHQIAVKNRAKVYGLAGRRMPPALPTE